VISALGFMPMTNSYAALSNTIGFTIATNPLPGFVWTGIIPYLGSNGTTHSTLYITNSLVVTNTTP
jgi:hypothetical protein